MYPLAPSLFGFLLVLFRCAAMLMSAPIFSARGVPTRARMGIALCVSFAVYAGAGFPRVLQWQSLHVLVMSALAESLIGLCAGTAARMAMEAAFGAGHLTATAMGLSYGSTIDPLNGSDSSAINELMLMLAAGTFLAAGGHREIVIWLCRSVIASPPGSPIDPRVLVQTVVTSALGSIALAVRLAYPVMAAVLVGQTVLGILGRTAPQLNISSIGFSVTILAGGGVLYVTVPVMVELVSRSALQLLVPAG